MRKRLDAGVGTEGARRVCRGGGRSGAKAGPDEGQGGANWSQFGPSGACSGPWRPIPRGAKIDQCFDFIGKSQTRRSRCAVICFLRQAERVRAVALPSRPGRVPIPVPSLSFPFLPFRRSSAGAADERRPSVGGGAVPMSSRCATAIAGQAGAYMWRLNSWIQCVQTRVRGRGRVIRPEQIFVATLDLGVNAPCVIYRRGGVKGRLKADAKQSSSIFGDEINGLGM